MPRPWTNTASRQSSTAAIGTATTDAMFVMEAHHDGGAGDIAAAVHELEGLVREHSAPTGVARITVR